MKQHGLRSSIIFRFALIVVAVIAVVSVASNFLINRQFEQYVEEQQGVRAAEMAQNLPFQYDSASDTWNLDYVHGMGMYALNEGYIIKLYDRRGEVLWDAENHDMTLCHQVMAVIEKRMQEERPDLKGDFVTKRYELTEGEELIGYLDVSYYSPYYLNENAFQFLSALNRILIAVGALSIVGAIFMGLLLANYIAKPISRTVEITKQISAGKYNIRFQDEVGTRELSELAQAVNQMAESLGQQEAMRKRLTSDVAHELRTPLANVSSYLEMMSEEVWEPTPERLGNCYDELQRLSGLVADLERLQQVESENLKLDKREVDLLELAGTVARQFETRLKAKRQRCTVDGSHAAVWADESRIQQVITNLVSNAIEYTGEGGSIQILVEDTCDSGILRVRDNGIGISKQDCKRIFERFYRTDQSRSRKNGGAGIGLTIVKTIVWAHGGNVSVESRLGEGSCFTIILPKTKM